MTHMKTDEVEEKIRRARGRIDSWIASLPKVENHVAPETSREQTATRLTAQAHVLERLAAPENRDALFWFLISFADYVLTNLVPPNYAVLPEQDQPATTVYAREDHS